MISFNVEIQLIRILTIWYA